MSRSNPQEHGTPNPAVRWFEWNGETGIVRYYDKETKANIDVPLPFAFLLLDRLGGVGGWHDPSQSSIFSNEVKDTRQDVLVVKSRKEGILAQGLYKDIKDRVAVVGGQFVVNCYIAFKRGDEYALGSMRMKGAALGAWMDFEKAHRAEIYDKAIAITGYTEGTKGRVTFRAPTFGLRPVTAEANERALVLDKKLQAYLEGYLQRNTQDRVDQGAAATDAYEPPPHDDTSLPTAVTDDDIPFAWLLPFVLPALGLLNALGGVA